MLHTFALKFKNKTWRVELADGFLCQAVADPLTLLAIFTTVAIPFRKLNCLSLAKRKKKVLKKRK